MKNRGMLNDSAKAISMDFLKREIDTVELRVYPFLDYGLKNDFILWLEKLNSTEIEILNRLQEEHHISYGKDYCICTLAFYDFIQKILAVTYVIDFLPESSPEVSGL